MKVEEAYQQTEQWFKEHEEEFNCTIEELDSWNGYLGDSRYYPMDELDDFLVGMTPTEILMRAFYGYDEDTWTGEGDRREHGSFNPHREWFGFNGYANLVSTDHKDYSAFLDKWLVDALVECRRHVEIPEEVSKWLDIIEGVV